MLDGVAVVLRVLPGWLTNYHVLRWHVKRNLQYFNELTVDDCLLNVSRLSCAMCEFNSFSIFDYGVTKLIMRNVLPCSSRP